MNGLRPYQAADLTKLSTYQLEADQDAYSRSPYQAIVVEKKLHQPSRHGVTVWHEAQPVGFFILDAGDDRALFSPHCDALLLRSFSINPDYQGQGLGHQVMALLPDYCARYLPSCREIVLGVNQQNQVAYRLYLSHGFVDTGNTRMGPSGPQFMLSLRWS
ncbi:MAG: GNAT family N-acetyltransferase [Neisseriaceae bacterium]|nr:GNAT family N-acetyltransferase [Neisseriaceae bacterium]MBP6861627.1 GNAT family N-acetyltransferase [Neisseriaceae bacterium]